MKKLLIILPIALIIVSGCYYDNEETLFPDLTENICDTNKFTFADIQQIIDENCLSCHRASAPILTDHAKIAANADAIFSAIESGRMPQGGIKLSSCKITQVKKWIDAGKLNN